MKYLSFSLWGDLTIYNEGAIKNADLKNTIYKDWKMVVYHDNTVPQNTLDRLKERGVLLKDITHLNLYGMFWRFLSNDLPDCEYSIFRDCDSRISEREEMAVNQWISSNMNFHVMRDHPAHAIPYGVNEPGILGGMWGLKSGILQMKDLINEYHINGKIGYGSDQIFLKKIYDDYRNQMFIHDDINGFKFPTERGSEGRFIGERITEEDLPLTNDHLILKK
jgi:hypothetical protein